jgi:hypothetical protein
MSDDIRPKILFLGAFFAGIIFTSSMLGSIIILAITYYFYINQSFFVNKNENEV